MNRINEIIDGMVDLGLLSLKEAGRVDVEYIEDWLSDGDYSDECIEDKIIESLE